MAGVSDIAFPFRGLDAHLSLLNSCRSVRFRGGTRLLRLPARTLVSQARKVSSTLTGVTTLQWWNGIHIQLRPEVRKNDESSSLSCSTYLTSLYPRPGIWPSKPKWLVQLQLERPFSRSSMDRAQPCEGCDTRSTRVGRTTAHRIVVLSARLIIVKSRSDSECADNAPLVSTAAHVFRNHVVSVQLRSGALRWSETVYMQGS